MAMQTPFWSYRECESTQRGRKRDVSISTLVASDSWWATDGKKGG